jgi:hypothetical protein
MKKTRVKKSRDTVPLKIAEKLLKITKFFQNLRDISQKKDNSPNIKKFNVKIYLLCLG